MEPHGMFLEWTLTALIYGETCRRLHYPLYNIQRVLVRSSIVCMQDQELLDLLLMT